MQGERANRKADPAIVFANFATDAARWRKVREKFAAAGLEIECELNDRVRDDALFLLNKTRYVDGNLTSHFKRLRGIVVLGREDWMIDTDLPTYCIDTDRGYEVAEHAVALLLAGLKRLHRFRDWKYRFAPRSIYGWFFARDANEISGAHNWTRIETGTLYGAKVGIVGYGQIGRQIHRRLAGFDAEVFYYHSQQYPRHVEDRLGIAYLPLVDMFQTCGAVFVQTPLTASTRGLVSGAVLKVCRPGLALINCGRAAVIDQAALTTALKEHRVGFYGTDVFWKEPMPLLTRYRFSNACLITPHMAESLPNRQFDLFDRAIRLIKEVQGGTFHAAA